jgi:hypothetical protein
VENHSTAWPSTAWPTNERPEWIIVKDGYDYCDLCHNFATDGHLNSERHKKRVDWYEWESEWKETGMSRREIWARDNGPPPEWGDPTHYELKDGWFRCRLCQAWVTDMRHVKSKRHQNRIHWAEWYALGNGSDSEGEPALPALPSQAGVHDEIVESTTAGSTSTNLAEDPWGPQWNALQDLKPAAVGCWRSAYSETHSRTYYYNLTTGERTWILPSVRQ